VVRSAVPAGSGHDLVDEFLGVRIGVLIQYPDHSLPAELCAVFVLVLINAIGNQAEHIAGLEHGHNRRLQIRLGHITERKSRGRVPLELSHLGLVMHDRTLAARVEPDRVGVCIQQAKEAGHEALIGQVFAELVIDVHEGVVKAGIQANRNAQHGAYLGRTESGTYAMAGCIAH